MIQSTSNDFLGGSAPLLTTISSTVEETLEKCRKTLENSRKLDEERANFKKELAETRKSTQETIDRITNSIKEFRSTMEKVQETHNKIDKMKQEFRDAITQALDTISVGFTCQTLNQGGTPIKATAKMAAEKMASCKKIMLLTGAGISVASGIPTFRGEGGLWTMRDSKETLKAVDFITHKYFLKDPEEIWRWHHAFKRRKEGATFNRAHVEIAELQCFSLLNNIPLMLVTQNIDEFHVEAFEEVVKKYPSLTKQLSNEWKDEKSNKYGLHPYVYAIHGSVNYIRHHDSVEEKTLKLYPYPEKYDETTQPLIEGKPSRPHTLFFDESYNEEFYRVQTVVSFGNDCDCLIVIGTALETNMASRLVLDAMARKAVIIEINPEPCIYVDDVLQLKGKSEDFIPELFRMYKSIKSSKDAAVKTSSSRVGVTIPNQPQQMISKAVQGSKSNGMVPKTINSSTNIKTPAVSRAIHSPQTAFKSTQGIKSSKASVNKNEIVKNKHVTQKTSVTAKKPIQY